MSRLSQNKSHILEWMINADQVTEVGSPDSSDDVVYYGAFIPIKAINILDQPRRTFEDIDILAESIARRRLLNPPNVALFDLNSAQRYIERLNGIWDRNYCIDDLVSIDVEGDERFCFLMAGERRTRACKYLFNEGCSRCKAEGYEGNCYERHFKRTTLEVRVASGIKPKEAVYTQFGENSHNALAPHEDASSIYKLYRREKEEEPTLTLTEFARRISKSADVVRNALRYFELPDPIKQAVVEKKLSYGIACEVARLRVFLSVDDEELIIQANQAMDNRENVDKVRERISGIITQRLAGQMNMLDDFLRNQSDAKKKLARRQTVNSQMVYGLCLIEEYLLYAAQLYEDGKLGVEGSRYSEASLIRHFLRANDRLNRILPYVSRSLKPGESDGVVSDILFRDETVRPLLDKLEGYQPPEIPVSDNGNGHHEPEADPSLQASLL